jgi:ABC transporter with metal-binding/Fe-S-binding domain ATP-binding protein
MKCTALFSGGKDSAYAIYIGLRDGFDIVCLVVISPLSSESYMFHYPNIDWVPLQAYLMGKPIIHRFTRGVKEVELKDLKLALRYSLKRYGVEAVISGAISSNYQKTRIDSICREIGLKSITPLWGLDPTRVLFDELKNGIKSVITGVYALGFNEEWLGRVIDDKCISEIKNLSLKYGVHPCGEGGEFETFCIDAPMFSRGIQIVNGRREWYGNHGIFRILEVTLHTRSIPLSNS